MWHRYAITDSDKDFDFLREGEFLTEFEIPRGTKIANHGMKYLEVGHGGGDAVELVQQLRLGIIEELGTHKAWRFGRFALLMGHKKRIRELLSGPRLWTAIPQNKKAHGYTVSISVFSLGYSKLSRFRST